jgi:hypothetical protein
MPPIYDVEIIIKLVDNVTIQVSRKLRAKSSGTSVFRLQQCNCRSSSRQRGGMEAEEDIPEVEPEPKLDETALEPLLAFA